MWSAGKGTPDPGIWTRGLEFVREGMEGLDRLPERLAPESDVVGKIALGLGLCSDSGSLVRGTSLNGDDPRWAEFAHADEEEMDKRLRHPFVSECRYELEDGPFRFRRMPMFVGGVRFLDGNGFPLEGVRYKIVEDSRYRPLVLMDALTGPGGWGDIQPFGDPLPLGALPYFGVTVDCPPGAAFVSVRYFSILSMPQFMKVLLGRGERYPLQPRRRSHVADGTLYSVTPKEWNVGPDPDREFYHRSRHPPGDCLTLPCFDRTAAVNSRFCPLAAELAAKKIQRAVLHMLYAPDTGPLFLKAKSRFARRAKKE